MPDPALDVPMRRTAPSPAHAELARTCQAGILTGHVRTSLAVLGLRLATPRLRPVLALLRPSVKSAARQLAEVEAFHDRGRPGTALVNVALSAAALRRLPGELPADRAFRAGMKHRQEAALGDPPVESWEPAYRQDLDVLSWWGPPAPGR
jgi:hypothetical protein